LLPLVVASGRQAGDDDGYHWRDTFGKVEARDCAPRCTCGVDGPAKRDDQRLKFVFWNRLDKGIKGTPCSCMHRYL
jgi:hypothetical protein